jgi:hypothetical protein
MRKNYLTVACISLLAASTFCACDKDKGNDDDNSGLALGRIEVENGNSYNGEIDTVKVVIEIEIEDGVVVYSAPYTNGGFTLNLPESVDNKYLEKIGEEMSGGFNVSNANVKGCAAILAAYKSGSVVGSFYHGTKIFPGALMYVDDALTVTGSQDEGEGMAITYNLSLKKGWNMVYPRLTETLIEISAIASKDAKWYFKESSDVDFISGGEGGDGSDDDNNDI